VPSPLKLEKVGYDLEFERLLRLASGFQTGEPLRPAEIGPVQRPEELSVQIATNSSGESPGGRRACLVS
jgi:hypothetical protein